MPRKDLHTVTWDMITQGKSGKIQIAGKNGSSFVLGSIELDNGAVTSVRCGRTAAREAAMAISRLSVERIVFMPTSPTGEKEPGTPDGADLLHIIINGSINQPRPVPAAALPAKV